MMTDLKSTWLRAVCITAMLGVTAGCAQRGVGLDGTLVGKRMNEMPGYDTAYSEDLDKILPMEDFPHISAKDRRKILERKQKLVTRFQAAVFSLVSGETRGQAVRKMKRDHAQCSKDICEWVSEPPKQWLMNFPRTRHLWRVHFLTDVISKSSDVNATLDTTGIN